MKTLVLAAALLILAVGAGGCKEPASEAAPTPEAAPKIKVQVETVAPTRIRDVLRLPGETEGIHEVVVSAESGGQVEWIGPQKGDTVQEGEEIAKVDLTVADTQLNQAQANYTLAQEQITRYRALRKQGVVSQEQLDQSIRDYTVALNQLNEAKLVYEQCIIESPVSGTVNDLYLDPGEFVNRGEPVAEIVNIDKIRIYVDAPELDVRFLKPGDQCLVTVDAYPDKHWMGTVDFVSFKADSATKTFSVRVVVDNPEGRIRPGMMARVAFERQVIEDALTAPLLAVVNKGGERVIFVEKDGIAHARTVDFGVITQDRIQITKGLEPGDKLIVGGQAMVEEGTEVVAQ